MGNRGRAWWLLTGGVIGPILFVVNFMIDGWTRAGYDPTTMVVSLLSLGDVGWQQIANFLVSGALVLGGAIGLRTVLDDGPGCRWVPRLIGLAGVGMMVAGIFATDPGYGYPPGTPSGMSVITSWHGVIHDVAALSAFGGLAAAMLVIARRFVGEGSRWALYSRASAAGTVAFLFAVSAFTDFRGLLQRVAILIALGWVAQVMWRFRREVAA